MTEFPPHEKGSVPEFLNRIHYDHQQWHTYAIMEAFGSDTKNLARDLTIIMEGILHSYLMAIIWRGANLSPERLGDFVVDCIHVLAENGERLSPVMPVHSGSPSDQMTIMKEDLKELYVIVEDTAERNHAEDKVLQTIELLMEELDQDNPREFLIDALLQQLYRRPNLKTGLQRFYQLGKYGKGI